MVIECCSQERTYSKFYGLIGERFAKLNRLWTELFEDCFRTYYDTIHRYETNRLRNIARFFGHQLATDALGWRVLSVVHVNEEETTSSSRIFVKILFQDLAECMGMKNLQERLKDPFLQDLFTGLFPKDNPRNTRFSINYFTSIGMGGVTEDMREHLKNHVAAQAAIAPPPPTKDGVSDTDSIDSGSSYSSYTGSSCSRSRSRSGSYGSRSRSQSRGRMQGKSNARARSYTRSVSTDSRSSRSRSRSRSRSKSYDSYSDRSKSYSRSRSRSLTPYGRKGKSRRSLSKDSKSSRSRSRSYTPIDKEVEKSRGGRNSRPLSFDGGPRKISARNRSYSSVSRSRSRSRTRSRSPSPKRSVKARRDSYSPPLGNRRRSPTPGGSRSRSRSPSRSRSRGRDAGKWGRYGGRMDGGDSYRRGGGRDRAFPRYRRDGDTRMRDSGRNQSPVTASGGEGGRGAGRVRAADFL